MPASSSKAVYAIDQFTHLSELASQLKRIFTEKKNKEAFLASSLINALLRIETPIKTPNLHQVIAVIQKHEENIIQSLNTDSVRCLTYLLLNSDDKSEQKIGLHILLDESQHLASIEPKQPRVKLTRNQNQSQLVQDKLTSVLYCLFIDEKQEIGTRRLCGKFLLEIIAQSRDPGNLWFEPQDHELSCHRVALIVFEESDSILRFFAGAVIRFLHLSSIISKDILSTAYGKEHVDIFFKSLQDIPDDWVRCFHSYIREVEELSEKLQRGAIKGTTFHLVRYIGIGSKNLSNDTALATYNSENLTLIIEPLKQCFRYVEIPLRSISRTRRTLAQCTDGRISHLVLQLDAAVPILINGERNSLSESTLSISSDDGLIELERTIDGICRKLKRKVTGSSTITRRSSSIVVSLDTGEEIARKSIGHSQEEFVKELYASSYSWVGNSMPMESMDQETQPEPDSVEHNNLTHIPELIQYSSSLSDYLSTIDLNSPNHDSHIQHTPQQPPQKKGTSHSSQSQTNEGEERMENESSTQETAKLYNKTTVIKSSNFGSATQEQPKSLDAPGGSFQKLGTRSTGSRAGSSSKSIKRASQKRENIRHQKTSRVSSNRKTRARQPDTQESLIFPLRRSKRKMYTAHSKAAVDWDEDLRPSDEAGETEAQKDSEITSISSPLPGGSSVFDRIKSNGKRNKRKCGANSSAKNRRKRLKRKNEEENQSSNEKGTSLSLDLRGKNDGDNETGCPSENRMSASDDIETHEKDSRSGIEKGGTNGYTDSLEYASNIALYADTVISALEKGTTPVLHEKQNCGDPSITKTIKDQDVEESAQYHDTGFKSGHAKGNDLQLPIEPQFQAIQHGGRGQTVGGKLAAAFHEDGSFSFTRVLPQNDDQDSNVGSGRRQWIKIPQFVSSPDLEVEELTRSSFHESMLEKGKYYETQSTELKLLNDTPQKDRESSANLRTITNAIDKAASQSSKEKNQNHFRDPEPKLSKSSSRKGTASQSPNDKPREKKSKTGVSSPSNPSIQSRSGDISSLGGRGPVESEDSVHDMRMQSEVNENPSWITKDEGKRNTLSSQKVGVGPVTRNVDTKYGTAADTPYVAAQTSYGCPKSTPRKTIVDKNGSPRLISRQSHVFHIVKDMKSEREQKQQLITRLETNESGYEADYDENSKEEISDTKLISSAFYDKHIINSASFSLTSDETPTDVSDFEGSAQANYEQTGSFTDRLRACTDKNNALKRRRFQIYFSCPPPPKATMTSKTGYTCRESDTLPPTLRHSSSMENLSSAQSSSESAELSTHSDEDLNQIDGQRLLQALGKSTQDMLLASSENLMHQLEKEKKTINKVLETYRQQYHRVLDKLFEKQEERIKLCREHMKTIRKHHADLCQELIHRLEENERHIENSMLTESVTSDMEERNTAHP